MNWKTYATLAMLAIPVPASCQSAKPASTGELTPSEMDRVTIPPPKDVRVKQEGESMAVAWKPSPLKRVVEYKVFRFDNDGKKFVEVGRTKSSNFPVTKVDLDSAFAVSAVDYRGNQSPLSLPTKTVEEPKSSGTAK